MQVDSPEQIRNVALVGHNDTGKTTLVGAALHTAGVATRLNKVEDGNTVTDFDSEEIARGISIGLAPAFVPWKSHKLNLIDCPGYGIFLTETKSALRAVDAGLLCVNGVSGVQVTTEKVWEFTEDLKLPTMVHVTKLDRENADFAKVVGELQERFDRNVLPIQIPIGKEHEIRGVVDLIHQKAIRFDYDGNGKGTVEDVPAELADQAQEWRTKLMEAVAESDDALMETFFEAGELSQEELVNGLKAAVRSRAIYPLTLSSSLHGIGTSALLDTTMELFPSPLERPAFPATTVGGEFLEVEPSVDEPTTALVFKTLNDPFTGKISMLRVVSGTLSSDAPLWNSRTEDNERLGSLLHLQGKQGENVAQLVTGDIGGVAKLKATKTGDTLADKSRAVNLGWIDVPVAAISFAIEPKSKGDEEKMGEAVHRLMEEDLSLHAGRDPQTGEYLLSGTGQLHIEIAVARL